MIALLATLLDLGLTIFIATFAANRAVKRILSARIRTLGTQDIVTYRKMYDLLLTMKVRDSIVPFLDKGDLAQITDLINNYNQTKEITPDA